MRLALQREAVGGGTLSWFSGVPFHSRHAPQWRKKKDKEYDAGKSKQVV